MTPGTRSAAVQASAPTGPGLADQQQGKRTARVVWGCMAALALGLGLVVAGPLVGIGLLQVADGGSHGWSLVWGGAVAPCIVVSVFFLSVPAALLLRSVGGGADGGFLEALQADLGGEIYRPSLRDFGHPPTLRAQIDGEKVKLHAVVLRRRRRGMAWMRAIEEPWAKTAASVPWGRQAIRLHMYTNHRAPFRLSFVSRTRLAGVGTGLAKLTELPLPEPLHRRIACYSNDVARGSRALSDPQLLEAVRALVESNVPYVTQLSFSEEGVRWASFATNRTDADGTVWRFRQCRWIAAQLSR